MRKIIKYLKPFTGWILVIIALTFVQAMVDLTLPDYMSQIVDVGIVQGDLPFIMTTGGKMLLITLLGAVCAVGVGFFSSRVATGFAKNLRDKIFVKVESFALEEFNRFCGSHLSYRTTNDIHKYNWIVVMLLRIVLMAPIVGIGAIWKIIQTQAEMAWVLVIAVPLLVGVIACLALFTMPKFKVLQKMVDRLNLVSRENLSGLRVIRAFNTEKIQEEKFDGVNKELTRINIF